MKTSRLLAGIHSRAVGLTASQMTVGCLAMFLYFIVFVLKGGNNELMHGIWGGGICILTGFTFGIQSGRKNKARYVTLAVMSVLSALTAVPLAYFAGDGAKHDIESEQGFGGKYGQVVCNCLIVACAAVEFILGLATTHFGVKAAKACDDHKQGGQVDGTTGDKYS